MDTSIGRAFSGRVAWPTLWLFAASLSLFLGSTILSSLSIWPYWLAILLNVIALYLLFTPMHEASHGNIAGGTASYRSLEHLIGWCSALALTVPYPIFVLLHHTHHAHTNDPERDPDYWVADRNPLRIFLRIISILPAYYYHFGTYLIQGKARTKREKRLIRQGLLGFSLSLGGLLFWGWQAGFAQPLLLWWLPAWIATSMLALAFDWAPHHPHSRQGRFVDTRIILMPGLSTLMVSQNLHLIHHLYPSVPFYHYGKVYRQVQGRLQENGTEIMEIALPGREKLQE